MRQTINKNVKNTMSDIESESFANFPPKFSYIQVNIVVGTNVLLLGDHLSRV